MSAPTHYRCSRCHASDVRLWRQYQTFLDHIDLLCRPCAIKNQRKHELDLRGDQIGWLIPAVPDLSPSPVDWRLPTGYTFWGYASVPDDGVAWWYRLPVVPPIEPWHRSIRRWLKVAVTR